MTDCLPVLLRVLTQKLEQLDVFLFERSEEAFSNSDNSEAFETNKLSSASKYN